VSLLKTETMVINMGPQHPSTHGVLRFILTTDGEVIHSAIPDIGYLHRGMEKIAEQITYHQFMPYTDRIDYLASMNCNWGYALTVERLMGIEVPRRAEFIRVLVGELNRIASHLIAVGAMGSDLGAFTPFLHAIREREWINDIMEMVCGVRLTFNYMRIGGVSYDLPEGFMQNLTEFLDYFEPKVKQFNDLLSYNKIFVERTSGVVPIPAEKAIGFSLAGPNLRASGVQWDLRRDDPYSVYRELEFEVPVGKGEYGETGDCLERYMIRINEMVESIGIIRQCIRMMPDGERIAKVPRVLKPPAGEIYARTEAPRGELGFYLISDGSQKPYRLKIRTGSFTAMSIIPDVAQGCLIADLVALIGSLDLIAPEIDR